MVDHITKSVYRLKSEHIDPDRILAPLYPSQEAQNGLWSDSPFFAGLEGNFDVSAGEGG
jgi:hypothetical protein